MELDVLKIWPDWQAVRLIGEGSFGKVYEIERNNFGIEEHCALKVISIPSSQSELQSLENDGMDEKSIYTYYRGLVEEFVQEIAVMSKLKGCTNIVGYEDYAVIEKKDSVGWNILIRMELLTALPNYIKQKSLNTADVVKMAIDICSALEICYNHRIIHRDIKPDNIFVNKKGDFKLGDFGVARTIDKNITGLSKKGTYTYMAPEVYKGSIYGTNVDLYSLGIVMYKMLNNNREPFLPPHPQPIKYTDKNNALERRLSGSMIPPPGNANKYLSNIVLKACAFNSANRYQHPSTMREDLIKINSQSNVSTILDYNHISASAVNKVNNNKSNQNQQKQTSLSSANSPQHNNRQTNNQQTIQANRTPTSTIVKQKPAVMYCRKCGKQLNTAANFCNYCGAKTIIK